MRHRGSVNRLFLFVVLLFHNGLLDREWFLELFFNGFLSIHYNYN